jgi:hypothetical protein
VFWLGISLSKFYDWRKRYGKLNEHNAQVPRDHWLTEEEKRAILDYERQYPLEGYRRLAFMMLDDDAAAASPATVYRVLKSADRLGRPSPSNERKGKGFHQPSRPHRHWHIDFSHLNICGTFYHLLSILDGYAAAICKKWKRRGCLVLSRRISVWLAADGTVESVTEAVPDKPNTPWSRIGRKYFLMQVQDHQLALKPTSLPKRGEIKGNPGQ